MLPPPSNSSTAPPGTRLIHFTRSKSLPTLRGVIFGKVPMAVASGGTREIVEATLLTTKLLHLFNAVVTIEDVQGRGKPAPDIFLEAARRLHVAPGECTVFEDSDEGLDAARAAGMSATDVRLVYRPGWRFGT